MGGPGTAWGLPAGSGAEAVPQAPSCEVWAPRGTAVVAPRPLFSPQDPAPEAPLPSRSLHPRRSPCPGAPGAGRAVAAPRLRGCGQGRDTRGAAGSPGPHLWRCRGPCRGPRSASRRRCPRGGHGGGGGASRRLPGGAGREARGRPGGAVEVVAAAGRERPCCGGNRRAWS